jgi:hypothetical protein
MLADSARRHPFAQSMPPHIPRGTAEPLALTNTCGPDMERETRGTVPPRLPDSTPTTSHRARTPPRSAGTYLYWCVLSVSFTGLVI